LLSAAAWGLEQPLVARAIVGGVDRQHPGTKYPPLLMCDALTTRTASGAGLVDREGKLHGVIVAAEKGEGRRGWTYAVPVTHVQRILRAADEQKSDGVVILKRRRPVVGMELAGRDDAVMVERVIRGGPAEKAGIKVGDEVLATDGVAIRAAYQAVVPTMFKQPGDTTTFRLRRGAEEVEATVVLGGGVEITSAPLDVIASFVEPKVQLIRDARGIVVNAPRGGVAEVAAQPPLPDDPPPAAAPTAADKLALLEKAMGRYQAVIEIQQRQIADEQKRRQEQEAQLQALRAEIEALRKTLAPK
jgi:hypothetical protein